MLGKYDSWKLAYPPEWDRPQICEDCEQEVDECECEEEEEEGEEEEIIYTSSFNIPPGQP